MQPGQYGIFGVCTGFSFPKTIKHIWSQDVFIFYDLEPIDFLGKFLKVSSGGLFSDFLMTISSGLRANDSKLPARVAKVVT